MRIERPRKSKPNHPSGSRTHDRGAEAPHRLEVLGRWRDPRAACTGTPRETPALGVPGPHAGPDAGDDLPEDVHPHPGVVRGGHDGAGRPRDQPRLARVELHSERHPFGDALPLAQLRLHHGAAEEPRGLARHGRGGDGAVDQRLLQSLPPLPGARRHADHRGAPGRGSRRRTSDLRRRLQQRGELAGVHRRRSRSRSDPGLPDPRRRPCRRREPGPPPRSRPSHRDAGCKGGRRARGLRVHRHVARHGVLQ